MDHPRMHVLAEQQGGGCVPAVVQPDGGPACSRLDVVASSSSPRHALAPSGWTSGCSWCATLWSNFQCLDL